MYASPQTRLDSKSIADQANAAIANMAPTAAAGSATEVAPKRANTKYPTFNTKDAIAQTADKTDLTAVQFKDRIMQYKSLLPGPSVSHLIRAQQSKAGGVLPAFSWRQAPAGCTADAWMYAKLKENVHLTRFADRSMIEFRSNGTYIALAERLKKLTQVDSSPPIGADILELTLEHFTFQDLVGYQVEMELGYDTPSVCKLNTHASVGLPYMMEMTTNDTSSGPKITGVTRLPDNMLGSSKFKLRDTPVPIIDHALSQANVLIQLFTQKSDKLTGVVARYQDLMTEHPWLTAFILKRKEEKMPRSEYCTKVRPYGCQPLAARLFCMNAVHPFESRVQNFLSNAESSVAYHFSPFNGGATLLVKHFIDRINGLVNAISYGDDQLWSFKLPDGRTLIWGPDVAAMDMSTTPAVVMRFLQFVRLAWKGVSLATLQMTAVWMSMALNHLVHLGGAFCAIKKTGLFSGVPGTTFINLFNSALIISLVKKHMRKAFSTLEAFVEALKLCLLDIKKYLNYDFKGVNLKGKNLEEVLGTSCFQFVKNAEDLRVTGITVPFLSMRFFPMRAGYIACPADMDKFGSSLVLARAGQSSPAARMSRIMGVYMSGGWIDQHLGNFLREAWTAAQTQCTKESQLSLDDCPSWVEEILEKFPEWKTCQGNLLTYEEMVKFNQGPEYIPERPTELPRSVSSSLDMDELLTGLDLGMTTGASSSSSSSSSSTSTQPHVNKKDTSRPATKADVDQHVEDLDALLSECAPSTDFSLNKMGHANAKSKSQTARNLVAKEARHLLKLSLKGVRTFGRLSKKVKDKVKAGTLDLDAVRKLVQSKMAEADLEEDDNAFEEWEELHTQLEMQDKYMQQLEEKLTLQQKDEEFESAGLSKFGQSWADADDDDDSDIAEYLQKFHVKMVDGAQLDDAPSNGTGFSLNDSFEI